MLGAALRERVADVIDKVRELTREAGGELDPSIEETFCHAAFLATVDVAERVSDCESGFAVEADGESASGFADIAAFRGAPVAEVAKRCLRWRDCIATVLMDEADRLEISRATVRDALWTTLHIFDVTLVRMCEAYENERQSLLDDLTGRG